MLICNDGYSSSLAARTLHRLGLTHATDLCGGYQAWPPGDGETDGLADKDVTAPQ